MRERLTDKQIDFVARQVPREPDDRDEMERAVGTREIPVLVTDEGRMLRGEEEILPFLD